jgi:hypothetical protein
MERPPFHTVGSRKRGDGAGATELPHLPSIKGGAAPLTSFGPLMDTGVVLQLVVDLLGEGEGLYVASVCRAWRGAYCRLRSRSRSGSCDEHGCGAAAPAQGETAEEGRCSPDAGGCFTTTSYRRCVLKYVESWQISARVIPRMLAGRESERSAAGSMRGSQALLRPRPVARPTRSLALLVATHVQGANLRQVDPTPSLCIVSTKFGWQHPHRVTSHQCDVQPAQHSALLCREFI